jgi:hypothetical protein
MCIITIDNIAALSCRQALIVDETQVPRENYRLKARHLQFCSRKVLSSAPPYERESNSQLSDDIYCLID